MCLHTSTLHENFARVSALQSYDREIASIKESTIRKRSYCLLCKNCSQERQNTILRFPADDLSIVIIFGSHLFVSTTSYYQTFMRTVQQESTVFSFYFYVRFSPNKQYIIFNHLNCGDYVNPNLIGSTASFYYIK